jgi:hypothetical protein
VGASVALARPVARTQALSRCQRHAGGVAVLPRPSGGSKATAAGQGTLGGLVITVRQPSAAETDEEGEIGDGK